MSLRDALIGASRFFEVKEIVSEKSMFERMSAGEWYGEKPDAELSRAFWRAKTGVGI